MWRYSIGLELEVRKGQEHVVVIKTNFLGEMPRLEKCLGCGGLRKKSFSMRCILHSVVLHLHYILFLSISTYSDSADPEISSSISHRQLQFRHIAYAKFPNNQYHMMSSNTKYTDIIVEITGQIGIIKVRNL